GGCQKWQVAFQLTVDHRWECTELIQHGEEGFKLSVDSEECIWQPTRRTTEQNTSPSFHCWPAKSATIVRYPRRITCRPPTRSHERAFILCGIAEEPTWPSLKPSVTVSL